MTLQFLKIKTCNIFLQNLILVIYIIIKTISKLKYYLTMLLILIHFLLSSYLLYQFLSSLAHYGKGFLKKIFINNIQFYNLNYQSDT